VLEEGPQRGEGEGAKLRFGAEKALGEDSGTSGLHVRQDPSYLLLVVLELGLSEGEVELTRGQEGPALRSVAVKGLGGCYLRSGTLWNGRGRWGVRIHGCCDGVCDGVRVLLYSDGHSGG